MTTQILCDLKDCPYEFRQLGPMSVQENVEYVTIHDTDKDRHFHKSCAREWMKTFAGSDIPNGWTMAGGYNIEDHLTPEGKPLNQLIVDKDSTEEWRVNPQCLERFPEAGQHEYHQACCRFPKSCSAWERVPKEDGVRDPDSVTGWAPGWSPRSDFGDEH